MDIKANKVLAVIPARYLSTRLPEKLLKPLGDKSILGRVYEKASLAATVNKVIVATDHDLIFEHCKTNGMAVVMTSDRHVSGTDRCAEVATMFPDYNLVVNVQGDEPFISPDMVDHLVSQVLSTGAPIGTLCSPFTELKSLEDPAKVKVLVNQKGKAIYFSRAIVPYKRDGSYEKELSLHLHHIGIYAFKREVLMIIPQLAQGKYEKAESLEQLRWLEHGLEIEVVNTVYSGFGIDTEDDYLLAVKIWNDSI